MKKFLRKSRASGSTRFLVERIIRNELAGRRYLSKSQRRNLRQVGDA